MPPLVPFAVFAAVVAAILYALQKWFRRILRYSLGQDRIDVQFVGKVMLRIPFGQIEEIRRIDGNPINDVIGFNALQSGRAFALSVVNRPFWESCLLIRRRGSLFGRIVITPDEPEMYVRAFEAWRLSGGLAPDGSMARSV